MLRSHLGDRIGFHISFLLDAGCHAHLLCQSSATFTFRQKYPVNHILCISTDCFNCFNPLTKLAKSAKRIWDKTQNEAAAFRTFYVQCNFQIVSQVITYFPARALMQLVLRCCLGHIDTWCSYMRPRPPRNVVRVTGTQRVFETHQNKDCASDVFCIFHVLDQFMKPL